MPKHWKGRTQDYFENWRRFFKAKYRGDNFFIAEKGGLELFS